MQTINIFFLILIFSFNLYLVFFKDYLKEKGKNVATREDIEEITKKIENVKLQLGHSQSQKTEFLDQHKLALINFYDDYIHWNEYSIKNISITINQVNMPDMIRQQIDFLSLQKSKVDKSFWRLCLFEVQDVQFINQLKKIYLETTDLHNITFDYLIQMETIAMHLKLGGFNSETIKNERLKHMNEFIKKRDLKEKTVIQMPNILMNLIRTKFTSLFD